MRPCRAPLLTAARWATPVLLLVQLLLVLLDVLTVTQAAVVFLLLEALLAGATVVLLVGGAGTYREARAAGEGRWAAAERSLWTVLPVPVAAAVVWEATTVRSLVLAAARRDDGAGPGRVAVPYARPLTATTAALTAVAAVEVAVLHAVVPWPGVRTALLVLGVWSAVAVAGTWAGFARHPHLLTGDGALLRCGPHVGVTVAAADVARVRRATSAGTRRAGAADGVLHLPVAGRTDVRVGLRAPVTARLPLGRTAEVTEVRVTADDVPALLRGLGALVPDGRT